MNARLRALLQSSRDAKLLIATSGIFAISFFGIQMLLRVLYILRLGHGPECVGLVGAAKVTDEQLAQAKSLKGATMPDGTIHD